ncbi:MAG: chemotaxis signal transduction protein [Firmicutes bacterium]|nr:chemotaxis signal transduction protein [Bacillota bacterium]
MAVQLVVFTLNNEEYGLDVSAVNGILRSKKFKIQSMPGVAKTLAGIINLRGQVNYIFNLRAKFGLPEGELAEESKFVMLNVHEANSGCIVDEVTDIVKLNDEDIQPQAVFVSRNGENYIRGIGKYQERLIIILDPEKLLAMEEAALIGEAV